MDISKAIKKACLAVVGAGSSLIIAACYGTYMEMEDMGLVHGRVTNGDGQGVPALEVCARVPGFGSECTTTNSNGDYAIDADEDFRNHAETDGLWVTVEDVDGSANGLYESTEVAVDSGNVPADVDIEVEEIPN